MFRSCHTVVPHGFAALPVSGDSYPSTEATQFIIGKAQAECRATLGRAPDIQVCMPRTNSRFTTRQRKRLSPHASSLIGCKPEGSVRR